MSLEGYRVITCESQDAVITVPIPEACKPLSCSVQTRNGSTGVLASFYDPEAHAWVVKHVPVDVGHAVVTVTVLALSDPTEAFELHIAVTSASEGVSVEELYELKRRSFDYRAARAARPDVHGAPRAWPPIGRERPKHPRDLVCLCAPQPMLSGYVLCGGGFTSDYPVYATGPAMPIATDLFYDCVIGDDPAFYAAVAAVEQLRREGRGEDPDPFLIYNLLRPENLSKSRTGRAAADSSRIEFSAWSVTAAPSEGLVCFSIGIRCRGATPLDEAARPLMDVRAMLAEDPTTPTPESKWLAGPESGSVVTPPPPPLPPTGPAGGHLMTPARTLQGSMMASAMLMSPSRFSSPDSDVSSPDSTDDGEQGPYRANRCRYRPRTSRREDVPGMMHSDASAAPSTRRATGDVTALVPHDGTAQQYGGTSRADGRPELLFSAQEVAEEMRTRKDLMRMVTLRKFITVTHRVRLHSMDMELPPPHGKIRARFGLAKETRVDADLFYHRDKQPFH